MPSPGGPRPRHTQSWQPGPGRDLRTLASRCPLPGGLGDASERASSGRGLSGLRCSVQVDLGAQYIKSAVKNVPSVFLMTDSQVAEEQFLVLINDLLASGEIPGLFADDEVENILSSVRPQVKALGMTDTRETCWKFFIEKVRRQLKVRLRVRRGRGLGAPLCVPGRGAAPSQDEETRWEGAVGGLRDVSCDQCTHTPSASPGG